MARVERHGNDYELDRALPDFRPLRERGKCVFGIASKAGCYYLVFDERGAEYLRLRAENSEERFAFAGGPVTLMVYNDAREWRTDTERMIAVFDGRPGTRRIDDLDGGAGVAVGVGGPPPTLEPGAARTIAEAQEPPRNP
jgi:hypothetical protein